MRRAAILSWMVLAAVTMPHAQASDGDRGGVRFLLQWGKQGDKPGEFHFPIGVAINVADEVFITDHYNDRVQKFDAGGKLLAVLKVKANPGGIALDKDGNIYLSHFSASRLKKERTPDRITVYSPAGKFLREWGKSGTGDGEFDFPGGLAISSAGQLYVADQTNRRIQVFDLNGKFLRKWGEYGTRPGQFGGGSSPRSRVGGPQFVALDSKGNVYTTEASPARVQVFTADGKFLRAWGSAEDRKAGFGGIFTGFKATLQGAIALCIDKRDRVWVSAVSGRVQQFTSDGKYLRGFGEVQGHEPGQFFAPHGLALDSHGQLYVVDAYNHRVQKFGVVP
jgi:DNA-binding beta-propeller fold protein YncE